MAQNLAQFHAQFRTQSSYCLLNCTPARPRPHRRRDRLQAAPDGQDQEDRRRQEGRHQVEGLSGGMPDPLVVSMSPVDNFFVLIRLILLWRMFSYNLPGPQDKRLTGNGEKLTYSCPAGCN